MSNEYRENFKERFFYNLKRKGILNEIPDQDIGEFLDSIMTLAEVHMPFIIQETEELTNMVLKSSELNITNRVEDIMGRIINLSDKFNKVKENLQYTEKNMLKWKENIGAIKNEIDIENTNIKKMALKGLFPDEIFDNGTFINLDKSFKKFQIPQVQLKVEYSWAFFCYFHLELLKFGTAQLDCFGETINYFFEMEKLLSQNILYEQIDRGELDECIEKVKNVFYDKELDSDFSNLFNYCESQIRILSEFEKEVLFDNEIIDIEKIDLRLIILNYKMIYCLLNLTKSEQYRYNYEFDFVDFLEKITLELEQDKNWVYEIIGLGESSNLEFKSSLLYDYKTNKKNNDLADVIGREIVAFMNTDGGKILIGVNDDGKILGIEQDYPYVYKNNPDGFLLRLDDLIGSKIGLGVSSLIDRKLIEIEDKQICVIEIKKSHEDVFYNKEDFYIRMGASIRKLSTKEYNDHKKQQEKATI